jgi:tripartite-type tricarboxylate transporter receptor subunit TctC
VKISIKAYGRLCAFFTLAAVVAAGIVMPAQALDLRGKRVSVIIGATPGGGTDGTTRLVGKFMEKYLPGHPRMIYRNMPAGNGVQATNYFSNEARPDGTYWMGGGNAYIDAHALRQKTVTYDPRKFHFIGGVARGGSIVSLHKARLANLTDRKLPPIVIGTGDGTGTWEEMLCWGADVLGWNIRFVVGYPGTPSLLLAARRGEIDSFGTSNLGMLASLRNSHNFKEIVQIGETRDGKVRPRGSAPDVPTMAALLEGKLSGTALQAFRYWSDSNQIDKWYAVPPGAGADVVAAYRDAYEKTVRDPDFIKFGKAQFSPDFHHQTAGEITRLVNETSYPSAVITDYTHKIRVRYGLPGQALSAEELARLAAKLVGSKSAKGPILKVERGGRILHFKAGVETHTARVSGSRTKVLIGGKKAKRAAIKAGMNCDIAYAGNGAEASKVACR